MGYTAKDGEFVDVDQDVLLDATTRTATGQSTPIEVKKGTGCFELSVTAASGTTPSMTVTIQTSKDGSGSGLGSWRTVATFTAATAATAERVSATSLDRFIRAVATISGTTPSFTYSVKGDLK
jgi:hypothetical protein